MLITLVKYFFCSVAKTSFQGTPESGNRNGAEKSDQVKSYTPVASKLAYNQSTGLAYGNVDGVKERNPALETRGAADVTAMPTILVQKGPCRSQSSDGPRDLDCDSNDLEGELVIFYLGNSIAKKTLSLGIH